MMSGRVSVKRSLLPRRSLGCARSRSPRKSASSRAYDWIIVPMAPSRTRMRCASAARSWVRRCLRSVIRQKKEAPSPIRTPEARLFSDLFNVAAIGRNSPRTVINCSRNLTRRHRADHGPFGRALQFARGTDRGEAQIRGDAHMRKKIYLHLPPLRTGLIPPDGNWPAYCETTPRNRESRTAQGPAWVGTRRHFLGGGGDDAARRPAR